MPAHRYEHTVNSEQIRVTGNNISELAVAIGAFLAHAEAGARWFTDGETLVLESPLGESLIGGAEWPPGEVP